MTPSSQATAPPWIWRTGIARSPRSGPGPPGVTRVVAAIAPLDASITLHRTRATGPPQVRDQRSVDCCRERGGGTEAPGHPPPPRGPHLDRRHLHHHGRLRDPLPEPPAVRALVRGWARLGRR